MKLKNKKGFTLIELLVVIVIIGILATLATVALSAAKVKARDAKRISDIKQMQTALELYYNEESTYPPTNALAAGQALVGAVSGKTFMGKIPAGPNTGETYSYNQINGGTSYTLGYVLEKPVNELAAGGYTAIPGIIGVGCSPSCAGKCAGEMDSCGKSVCAVSDATAVAPATVTVQSTGSGTATLTWSTVPGASQYKIYRNTTINPTVAHPTSPTVTGTTLNDTGLSTTAGTTYYYRVIATVCGTDSAYSNNASFSVPYAECPVGTCGDGTTLSCGVTDFVANGSLTLSSGNASAYEAATTYQAVKVGTQCWLNKNINIGTYTVASATGQDGAGIQRFCYSNTVANCNNSPYDGGLYTWAEAMYLPSSFNTTAFTGYTGTDATAKRQGICPTGWHIPSDYEQAILEDYLDTSAIPPIGGGATCSTSNWGYYADINRSSTYYCSNSLAPYNGSNFYGTDCGLKMKGSSSGLNVPLAGYSIDTSFDVRYSYGELWSSTQFAAGYAYNIDLRLQDNLKRSAGAKTLSVSVRCIKD